VIAGVCGGIAEFFGIDATLVRIAAVLLIFAGGAGLLLYAIGWLVMPEAPPGAEGEAPPADDRATRTAFGVILIVLGTAFLLDELDWLETRYLWPVALILVGLAVLARARR
jgi:phage shock protein C